ncbi:hypothetical protein OHA72_06255 [Dactylosporangium sp. NBC_01737]|uniref:PIN-like domain-containing protein n=1 Tax=Dactylosporangium sp. NBC_01737 TaxID=2975959 RepID=UPI002E131FB0|nr:hypothetical protein OHA72_06255 [Dactylosporangium sp. NBC_01737]
MPLEFLADRSLGKRVVNSLREAGLTIHTLADVFGEADSQLVEDTNWIACAGSHRWACLTVFRANDTANDALVTVRLSKP